MRIVNLIENTEGVSGCTAAHGLSFYVETGKHKLLLDLGPSDETLSNADRLGIDLSAIDTVVLSHGHYDHSGGILAFAQRNPEAAIYMQENAPGEYYADEGPLAEERYRYIGIDKQIALLPQVKRVSGNYTIDEGLQLFQVHDRSHELPFTNRSLLIRQEDGFVQDDFRHEQYLVITEGQKHVLMSGCAHNGILSILDEYRALFGADPDFAVSGFHLMKRTGYKERQLEAIRSIAEELKEYRTRFVTCHCTGLTAYEIMKEIMGDQLGYVHAGEEVPV